MRFANLLVSTLAAPTVFTSALNQQIAVLDRFTGLEVAEVPTPPGGFLLPFSLRVPTPGHLVVLDSGGFPNPNIPSIARSLIPELSIGRKNGEAISKNDADPIAAGLGPWPALSSIRELDLTTSSRAGTRQEEASRG